MFRKSTTSALLSLLIVTFFAACRPAGAGDVEPKKAGALEGLTFVKGGPVTLEAGKVYVVEFWATWCPPCRKSIPHLTKVQKEYADKDVTVIGISTEALDKVKTFVEQKGDEMAYTVAVVGKDSSVRKDYMGAYNRRGIPSAFIVDQAGNVVWVGHPMGGLDAALKKVVGVAAEDEAEKKPEEPKTEQQPL